MKSNFKRNLVGAGGFRTAGNGEKWTVSDTAWESVGCGKCYVIAPVTSRRAPYDAATPTPTGPTLLL